MPFQKGQSGNAGGRPKGAGELKERARGYTEAAVAVLVAALSGKDQKLRVQAAQILLDRGWGRAEQQNEHAFGGDVRIIVDTGIRRSVVEQDHQEQPFILEQLTPSAEPEDNIGGRPCYRSGELAADHGGHLNTPPTRSATLHRGPR